MRQCFLVCAVGVMLAVVSVVAAAPAPKKAAPAAPAPTAADVRADIGRILADAGVPPSSITARAVVLPSADGKVPAEVLYAARADQPAIPASNMKLVTTAACFDRYGPEWRLRTYIGHIKAAGKDARFDLAVIGGGDPNLSGRFFDDDTVGAFRRWAAVLKERGITSVGRLVLDDSIFDETFQHPHWPADQRAEWYEAPVSGLVLNDSCINIHVAPGKPGEAARVTLDPACGGVAVEGVIQTVAEKGATFSIAAIPEAAAGAAMKLKIGGRISASASEITECRTVVNPTMFFGEALAQTLRAEGVAVAGPVVRERLCDAAGKPRADFVPDVIHASRLGGTVAVANKRSQALYAECLCKILGAFGASAQIEGLLPPRQGSWAAGTAEARKWMDERGIPTAGCVLDDGSGLSKENRLTALAVSELLAVMYARHGEAFVQTLAIGGEDGSLSKRMKNTDAAGRVFAKTGYVLGTSALSGYVYAKSGRTIAFSMIMNDVKDLGKARDAQDKVCERLVDY